MKRVPHLLLLAIVVLIWAASAQAQLTVTADIPFNFVAGDREFKSGKCTFDRPERSGNALTIKVRCGKTESAVGALPVVEPGLTLKEGLKNQISFRRYGDQYFLSEVWIKNIGAEINRSPREHAAAKTGAEARVVNLKVKGS